jgi:hypothetical protein
VTPYLQQASKLMCAGPFNWRPACLIRYSLLGHTVVIMGLIGSRRRKMKQIQISYGSFVYVYTIRRWIRKLVNNELVQHFLRKNVHI